MRQGDKQLGTPQIIYVETKANIEAMTSLEAGAIAFANDQPGDRAFGTFNGSAWTWGQGPIIHPFLLMGG